jgi:nucleotide-binding universal stress UspA family protein
MLRLDRVLVSVDFSPASPEVLATLGMLELAGGSTVLLVHVVPDLISASVAYVKDPQIRQVQRDVEARAAQMLEELAASSLNPGCSWEAVVGRGDAASCILKLARERRTNLIVLGNSDQSKEAGIRFGSTAEKVVRSAPCPVLIVPVGGI